MGSGKLTAESVQIDHPSLTGYYGWQIRDLILGVEDTSGYCGKQLDKYLILNLTTVNDVLYRSQWPRRLRRRSAAAHLLRSWVRIPPGDDCLSVVSVVCCEVEVSATS